MRRRLGITGLAGLGLLGALGGSAHAAPTLRLQVDQKGDFLLIGNTLGHDCGNNTPAPIVGTLGACGNGGTLGDSAPDVFWRSDSPADGGAEANTGIAVADARSTAVLTIPPGATVTHAYLYWGARLGVVGTDTQVTLDRVGPGAFSTGVTAFASYNPPTGGGYYQSLADITSVVQANGSGAYRVSGVNAANFVNATSNTNFAGWWMVVFYEDPTLPPRNLALFDGLDEVDDGSPQNVTLSGFLVPNAGFTAKLGVITYEGDGSISGDQLLFNGPPALTDAQNPDNDFFNGTRSNLGAQVTVAGDLPQLSGAPLSMSGMDLDVLDVTSKVNGGDTSAAITASSTGDIYYLAGWITSISTFKPDFSTSNKTAVDLNGGALLPGDVIEYTVVVTNTGNDTSINTVLTDPIPAGVTYVPGSLAITAGANMGPKTDLPIDDQGEYNPVNTTLTVRLGTGANGLQGGQMLVDDTTTVTFRVTVDANASGTISNQATINAGGLQGAPPEDDITDGNGPAGGSPPTDVVIDLCATDADCAAPTPYCDTSASPNLCVECYLDGQCGGATPACDLGTNTCICIPSGPEVCDGTDNNCDGTVDEGCTDSDMDGIPDPIETGIGTNPNDADSDDDGVPDGAEPSFGDDSDGDGLINALDPDSDNDGLFDGTELGLDCSNAATDASAGHCVADGDGGATVTDPLDPDTDDGGVSDGNEDLDLDGVIDPGETNPTAGNGADDGAVTDSDGDGLSDPLEETLGSDPNDADTDDDGVIDGDEINPADDTDGDGLINVLDVDSDNDGLYDGTELGLDCSNPATDASLGHCKPDADGGATTTSPVDPDTDDGGVSDGQEDTNQNGAIDGDETDPTTGNGGDDNPPTDTDGDGLGDAIEILTGTDPNDPDSDDDGVIDGQEPNFNDDHDGDGLINALDPDSDGDGLFDGTELGLDCSNPATDPASATCTPDGDGGATTTNPLDPDTDDGGISDGAEDADHDGVIDPGEGDPNDPTDDIPVMDSDGDGIPDTIELQIGTDPNDADTDDDGVSDGQEPDVDVDTDGDGLINGLDVDSDNDGLLDGTELGLDCNGPGTDASLGHCTPDADGGVTTTDPLDVDTDDGGVSDGNEDTNLDGAIDPGETNPTTGNGGDDVPPTDTDGDGLGDDLEVLLGTDPNDADSDDDGVIDGQEPNYSDDADGDGQINALDHDSDGDGLFDGTELGLDCGNPATDPAAAHCTPDGDGGATTTNPLDPDTDNGGISDGDEDADKDGVVDPGETDPNDGADDIAVPECDEDSDCGGPTSGMVCNEDTQACEDGCRGEGGNGCPDGQVCTSTTTAIGVCVDEEPECTTDADCGDAASGMICDPATNTCGPGCRGTGGNGCPDGLICSSDDGTAGTCSEPDPIVAEGNGLLCAAQPARRDDSGAGWLAGLAALAGLAWRRRRAGR